MQFFFIRHAQSSNNALWERTGASAGRSEDPSLTDLGREQAEILADFLCWGSPEGGRDCPPGNSIGFGITHLYSSLMLRAVMTGAYVAEALGLPLLGWTEIHEEGGIYLENETTGELIGQPGKDRRYFETHFPNLVLPDDFDDAGWWAGRPFEDDEIRLPRAKQALARLLEKHSGEHDRVAVISHGGFYNLFLRVLLGLPQKNGMWFSINNAAITRIDFYEEMFSVVYQNRMDFLPPYLIT
jgi:2,3-bisphosphoglycerate-dependent phosphoglycerate mutase